MNILPSFIQTFIAYEQEKAFLNHISFELQDVEQVKYAARLCNGFFEAEWPLEPSLHKFPYLTTATQKPIEEWLPILVHETCHMDQFLEKNRYWMTTKEYSVLDQWLEGKDYPLLEITNTIHRIILLEADCEIRTIQKIKDYSLPVNIELYAQQANSYLYFHHWMLKNRQWCNISPRKIKAILELMPIFLFTSEDYLITPNDMIIQSFNLCR